MTKRQLQSIETKKKILQAVKDLLLARFMYILKKKKLLY